MNFHYDVRKMNQTNGYYYIRCHPSYDIYEACKGGICENIPERENTYITGEITRGYFELVFEVPNENMRHIERLIKYEFRELNVKYDAGTEFYNKKIITLIEPYLITLGIKYRKLTKQEISNLVRCNRVRKTIDKINIQSLIHILKSKRTNNISNANIDKSDDESIVNVENIKMYNPRDYQKTIIKNSYEYFKINEKGLLIILIFIMIKLFLKLLYA